MEFHEQLWLILNNYSSSQNIVESELIYSIIRILMDPARISYLKTACLIKEYLEKFKKNISNEKSEGFF